MHGDLHVADGTSRGSQSGQSSSLGVSKPDCKEGSDGRYLDSKLRSRWSFLITGIDSARPGSRTAVSLFLPIRLKSSIRLSKSRGLDPPCLSSALALEAKEDRFWYARPNHKTWRHLLGGSGYKYVELL